MCCKMAYITPMKVTLNLKHLFSDYHLLLAQEFASLDEQWYAKAVDFWRNRTGAGNFVILDNGAYELGAAMDSGVYAEVCRAIKPSEIVLPDVLRDPKASMKLAYDFYQMNKHWIPHNTKIMAVIQLDSRNKELDNTEEQMGMVYEQLDFYTKNLPVTTIGIPKHFGDERVYGRISWLENFNTFLQRHVRFLDSLEFHCLGLSCIPEISEIPKYKWVRGLDTAAPMVFAMHQALMENFMDVSVGKAVRRPDDFFELSNIKGISKYLTRNVEFCSKFLKRADRQFRYSSVKPDKFYR